MRIVYMGTPKFACAPLERLYDDGHDIACVFTQPDKPRNRGMNISYSPVKELALARGTTVFQPPTLRDASAVGLIREQRCEAIAVVAYGKLLTREILGIPPLGCINLHASLLPKYRGAAPIQWAVINGETETGVTSMYMSEELDAGDILLAKKSIIGNDETTGDLLEKLSIMGAELLSETIVAIASGKATRIPQNHDEATFAPSLRKEMSSIDWSQSAHSIKCKVRGLNPWPTATAKFNDTVFKVFSVDIGKKEWAGINAGTIVSAGPHGIEIACADGTVIIKELQAPGGKRMTASEYARGHPLC